MIYTENNRGAVQFGDRKNQTINFNNIKIGNITPCDIDLVCEIRKKFTTEYHNVGWIFTEFKHGNAPFPYGQRLMYERLVDDISKTDKPAVSILAEHYVDNPADDVDAAKCIVREFYYQGKWYKPKNKYTLGEVIKRFIGKLVE